MHRFKNILYLADTKNLVSHALTRAAKFAKINGARLTVIDVSRSILSSWALSPEPASPDC